MNKKVTVQLITDFTGYAKISDWVVKSVDVQRIGEALSFANAYLYKNNERISPSSGIYRDLN